jgi:hypothetical protein
VSGEAPKGWHFHYQPERGPNGSLAALSHEDLSPGHRGRVYRPHIHANPDGTPVPGAMGRPSTKRGPMPDNLSRRQGAIWTPRGLYNPREH